jgi:hypothetical protein
VIFDLIGWWRESGDIVIADIAHFLATPISEVRAMPLSRLFRMHQQAIRIARLTRR